MSENNYVCARWRDAITDPPPEGWVGLVSRGGLHEITRWAYFESPNFREERHNKLDGVRFWLDVTDTPAVPRAGVQAAVDEMVSRYWHGVNCIINGDSSQCEECAFDKYPLPLCKSLACIEHFTGITPTVEP